MAIDAAMKQSDPQHRRRDWIVQAGDDAASVPEILTASQVARLLQLRESTVLDYARREVLPSIRLGRHVRFIRSAIVAHVLELTAESANPYRRR